MKMIEIDKKFVEVNNMMQDKINELVDKSENKVLKLTPKQTKELGLYTTHDIVEIGKNSSIRKNVYIKDKGGIVTAFDILPMQIQYNILALIAD